MQSDRTITDRAPVSPEQRLLRAVHRALGGDRADAGELRAAVAGYVQVARARSAPPQEVLVCLKQHVQRGAPPEVPPRDVTALAARVVQWGIDEYYRGAGA